MPASLGALALLLASCSWLQATAAASDTHPWDMGVWYEALLAGRNAIGRSVPLPPLLNHPTSPKLEMSPDAAEPDPPDAPQQPQPSGSPPPVIDLPATQELLTVLFQAVLPALKDASVGRIPLSPQCIDVLDKAHTLARLAGLDTLPTVDRTGGVMKDSSTHTTNTGMHSGGSSSSARRHSGDRDEEEDSGLPAAVSKGMQELTRAVTAFASKLCDVSQSAAGQDLRSQPLGEEEWRASSHHILKEVPVVKRVVVAVMHGLDLWASHDTEPHDRSPDQNAQRQRRLLGKHRGITGAGADGNAESSDSNEARSLSAEVRDAGRALLRLVAHVEGCASRAKVATVVLHISKSGGSAMCELARLAKLRNPAMFLSRNCKIQTWHTSPLWMNRVPEGVPPECAGKGKATHWLLGRNSCEEWLAKPEVTCREREHYMARHKFNYAMNEVGLVGGEDDLPGSAHTCPRFASAITLRDPLHRITSHLAHILRVYNIDAKHWCANQTALPPPAVPATSPGPATSTSSNPPSSSAAPEPEQLSWPAIHPNLEAWAQVSPQVVDNYILRHLLGKPAMCREVRIEGGNMVSAFTSQDALQGAATLLQFDHIIAALAEAPLPAELTGVTAHASGRYSSSSTDEHRGSPQQMQVLAGLLSKYTGDVLMRVGMGWPHSLTTVAGRIANEPHELERDMGLPPGSESALVGMNAWDSAVVALGVRLAALDAAVTATTAVMQERFKVADQKEGSQLDEAAAQGGEAARPQPQGGMPRQAAGGSIPAKADSVQTLNATLAPADLPHYASWVAHVYQRPVQLFTATFSSNRQRPRPAPEAPPPLVVLPHLLLFNTWKGLPEDNVAVFLPAKAG